MMLGGDFWFNFDPLKIFYSYLALLVTIIGCELALAYLARYYVADCVESNGLVNPDGNISFNPIRYFDLVGTVIIPLVMLLSQAPILFGWPKSLWLNMQKILNVHGINIAILLSLSGVIFHLFIAFLSSLLLSWGILPSANDFLQLLILINVVFVIIKLCPILPYDGLKILSLIGLKFGSDFFVRLYLGLIPYGIIILVILMVTPFGAIIMVPVRSLLSFLGVNV